MKRAPKKLPTKKRFGNFLLVAKEVMEIHTYMEVDRMNRLRIVTSRGTKKFSGSQARAVWNWLAEMYKCGESPLPVL